MACSACGVIARPGAKFCHECGARLEWVCPGCGVPVAPDQRFCAECGAPLPGAATSEPPARFASPRGYTPAHLAERILKERTALEGERKQVTVLFADVSGFTSLAETLDPEAVHALMSRAFELMLAEIHRYEGTVNQFLGDGLMALFGAPVAHEDHARRAALATLGMQAVLAGYRDELSRARGIDFRVRMGLNTGLVVVGAIGDNLRMDYTAVGDTTNVAARMQQIAQPGQVVVADATRRLIEPWFELEPLGTVAVKNRAEPVTAWSLLRPRCGEAVRHLSPLVGRADALAVLERAAEAARGGRGRAVYVVGEPGIGKSRLLLELRQQLGDSMTWIEGRCLSFGQSTPFLPLMDALRQLFEITDTDSESQAIEKVTRELERLGERASGVGPYMRFALALDPGDATVVEMDPAARLERLLRATSLVYRLNSQLKPIVMVIEDLHWIDVGSESYLKTVVDDLGGLTALVVLTWRPSYRPPFNEHTYVSRIVLEPLVDDDALALVRSTLGIENLPDDLARVIARKAEGNPFFLEEIGRALIDTGAARAEGGRLTLARPVSAILVPDRVQDVIAARIDRLSEDQKRTVQTASVIGREFALRLLRRVADAADRAERALAELKALEFVYEKAALEDLEYVFKHALTQDVAYESILQARRKELHARIGSAIEELYADRLEEHVEELAYHFVRGEAWGKATRFARQAGDRAAALCVDAKAVEFYEQTLAALARLPETATTAGLGVDVRLAMRAPLWRGGQPDRLFSLFKEAEALATRHGATEHLDTIYAFLVQYYWAKGEQDKALDYGRRCLERAATRDDLGLRVTGLFYLAHAHHALGQFTDGLARARELITLLEGPKSTERFGLSGLPYSGACAQGAECLSELGDHEEAVAMIRQGERVANAANHLYSKMVLNQALGEALTIEGRVDDAIPLLEETARTCRERNFLGQLVNALKNLGRAYVVAGRPADAIAPTQESIDLQDRAKVYVLRSLQHTTLGMAHLALGDLERAEAELRTASGFAERGGERGSEGWLRLERAQLAHRRADRRAARGELQKAMAIATELGMRPLIHRCEQSLTALG